MTRTDRAAEARAEAERRWFPGHDHEDCIKCRIDVQVREGFELGVVWADANPKPRTITFPAFERAMNEHGIQQGETVQGIVELMADLGVRIEVTDDE